MSLRLKRNPSGALRPHFYGRYSVDGKLKDVNLGIKWKGTPPEDLREQGCPTFERSREQAQRKLAEIQDEAQRKGRAEHLTEKLIESKTGRKLVYAKLSQLPSLWRSMPRSRPVSDSHLDACDSKFVRFESFMNTPPRNAIYLHDVTEFDVAEHLRTLQETYSDETVRQSINLLRGAFARFLPVGVINPFQNLRLRGDETSGTIHRKPFTTQELTKLLEVARKDKLLYPLVVCAACTGMRKGDVCRLRWADVDLQAGVINCKTGKTREKLEIPIFGPLLEVLDQQPKTSNDVFPEAAKMVETKSGGQKLTRRFKLLVATALAGDEVLPEEPELTPEAAQELGLDAISKITRDGSPRHERMVNVLRAYTGGASYREIGARFGYSKGQISGDLGVIEDQLDQRIRRTNWQGIRDRVRQVTNVQGEGRKNAASVRDWHALRVTFVTIALSAGVPMELVRRITGHRTVDIVLKHYFRPDREHFKAVMVDKMPFVLTGISEQRKPERELLASATKIASGQYMSEDLDRLIEQAKEMKSRCK
ncbi:MAG: tyrosine-type recombinase/integrase [Verrucomicrobia bacterium]|nr:tyrosine-type recombinase/integrase [Verrucomicrobiota bacterium]